MDITVHCFFRDWTTIESRSISISHAAITPATDAFMKHLQLLLPHYPKRNVSDIDNFIFSKVKVISMSTVFPGLMHVLAKSPKMKDASLRIIRRISGIIIDVDDVITDGRSLMTATSGALEKIIRLTSIVGFPKNGSIMSRIGALREITMIEKRSLYMITGESALAEQFKETLFRMILNERVVHGELVDKLEDIDFDMLCFDQSTSIADKVMRDTEPTHIVGTKRLYASTSEYLQNLWDASITSTMPPPLKRTSIHQDKITNMLSKPPTW